MAREPMVAREWLAWCAKNLATGAPRADVEAALVAEGATARDATRARLVASMLEKARRAAPSGAAIPRIAWPGPDALVERYLATSTPVIVTGLVSSWPAMTR